MEKTSIICFQVSAEYNSEGTDKNPTNSWTKYICENTLKGDASAKLKQYSVVQCLHFEGNYL